MVTNVGHRPLQLIDGTSQFISVPIDAVLLGVDEQMDDPEIFFTYDPDSVTGYRDVEVMLVNATTSADVSGMCHLGRFRTYDGQARWDLFVRNAPEQAEQTTCEIREQVSQKQDGESAPEPPAAIEPEKDEPDRFTTEVDEGGFRHVHGGVDEEPEQTVES